MGMRAAQKGDLLDAGQADVRHELAAAVEVPLVLLAQQRGADAAPRIALGSRHDPRPAAGPSAAAASAMALTMLV